MKTTRLLKLMADPYEPTWNGMFTPTLYDAARKQGWTVISIKYD